MITVVNYDLGFGYPAPAKLGGTKISKICFSEYLIQLFSPFIVYFNLSLILPLKFLLCIYIFSHDFLIHFLKSFVKLIIMNLPVICIFLVLILQINSIFFGDISIFCYL